MSGFPRERVISLFSTIAHGVFHLIQAPNNQPFVRCAQESRHAMCWTNARILKQCFKKVVIVRWCFFDFRRLEQKSIWRSQNFQILTGYIGEIVTWSKTFEAEEPWYYQSLTLATTAIEGTPQRGGTRGKEWINRGDEGTCSTLKPS